MFKICTYQPEKHSNTIHQFYIQSKGNNAGRPLKEPKVNCWIVETDIVLAYELCMVLWVSKIYEPHIIGSVVPFLRTYDYLKITLPYLASANDYENSIIEGLNKISNCEKMIDITLSKLNLIKSFKIVTANELIKEMHTQAS